MAAQSHLAGMLATRTTPRRAPALVVRIPLEGQGRISFDAATFEDEMRLRSWLHRSGKLHRLQDVIEMLVDQLDEEAEAA